MAQLDVDNAFYRISTLPGAEECFILPHVSVKELVRLGVKVGSEFSEHSYLSPALVVLPMGFSWSLYFCQALVESRVVVSGVDESHLMRDRHILPVLGQGDIFSAV